MSNFKQATRIGLRVSTSQGPLSVEQLWQLSLNKLAILIKNVKKSLQLDNDDDLSFLDETKKVDPVLQLTFDILKEIYVTKKTEAETEKNAANVKAHNEKIMALIHKQQEKALGEKSVEELTAMLIPTS